MRGNGILAALPAHHGHFLLESGYHTDLWFSLEALFVEPHAIAPLAAGLAEKLRAHRIGAFCGPLQGGAFLAQALATITGLDFYYTEPLAASDAGLFTAQYRLPSGLHQRVRGQRVAVVDDVISAGSSVRATMAELDSDGAVTVVVGALLVLGDAAVQHCAERGVPVESLARRDFNLWTPADCPLCRSGVVLEDPRD